jgi:hypothetical protein
VKLNRNSGSFESDPSFGRTYAVLTQHERDTKCLSGAILPGLCFFNSTVCFSLSEKAAAHSKRMDPKSTLQVR